MNSHFARGLAVMACLSGIVHISASEMEPRKGFFWGGALGGAYLARNFSQTNGVDDAAARFYMEAFGGYALNPHVAVGLELGGWLIEPDSDTYQWNPYWPPDNTPSENPSGEGLEQILAFTRIYPRADEGFFLKLGGGYLNHWVKTSGGIFNEEGWTTVAGLGWDIHCSGSWSFTPQINYSYGDAGNQTHSAITASLGFMWHQWQGPDRYRSIRQSAADEMKADRAPNEGRI